jgi:hypothetical protein
MSDYPHGRKARPRRLEAEEGRALAGHDAAPEALLGGEQQVLVEHIGVDGDLDPLAAAGDYRQNGALRLDHPHVVLELGHVLLRRALL